LGFICILLYIDLLIAYSKFVAVWAWNSSKKFTSGCGLGAGFDSLLMVVTKETLNLGKSSHGIVKFIVCLVFKIGHVLL
jgi:hypothetical protein